MVPRGALLGAAGLVAISLLSVAAARIVGTPSMIPSSSVVTAADLRFEDRADGGVNVFEGASAQPSHVITPGTNAFVRATVRGLAQQRKREGLGGETPFRLTAWTDGRLTLDDPATGRHVELVAFGRTNSGAFARLLTAEDAPR
jgi:putative photosynthetic complex assembly protein